MAKDGSLDAIFPCQFTVVVSTILDKTDGKFVTTLPPKLMMRKWRVLAFTRLHPRFGGGGGGDGSLLYHFILFKIVCELRLALLTASSIAIMTINLCTNVSNLSSFKENLVIYQ